MKIENDNANFVKMLDADDDTPKCSNSSTFPGRTTFVFVSWQLCRIVQLSKFVKMCLGSTCTVFQFRLKKLCLQLTGGLKRGGKVANKVIFWQNIILKWPSLT